MWKQTGVNLQEINDLSKNSLAETLKINFVEIGERYLKATMPVNEITHQPFGLLHGGASAALAETIGSVASWLCIDPQKQLAVGLEINCNHLRGKRSGIVYATAVPLHIGSTTHVWDIKIHDEVEHLICVSRLTMAIIKRKE